VKTLIHFRHESGEFIMIRKKVYLSAFLLFLTSGVATAQDNTFGIVGVDLSQLSASAEQVKVERDFTNASKLFEEFAQKAKDLSEEDFNVFAKKKYDFAGEDPDESIEFIYNNYSQISGHEPKFVLRSNNFIHLMVEIKYEDGESYLVREDMKCSNFDCKFIIESMPQDFERLYSGYLNAFEGDTLLEQPNLVPLLEIEEFKVYYTPQTTNDTELLTSFNIVYREYYEKVDKLLTLPSEEEYAKAIKSVMGFEAESREDNFLSISWDEPKGEVFNSDFLTYSDMINDLGTDPEVHDFFDDGDIIYVLLSPKGKTDRPYVLAYDSKNKEIVNGRKYRRYSSLMVPKLLLALAAE